MKKSLHWFGPNTLRLSDNPSLTDAAEADEVLLVFIHDNCHPGEAMPGAASLLWLHHSLTDLNQRLEGKLHCFEGDPLKIIPELVRHYDIDGVFWNEHFEPWQRKRDQALLTILKKSSIKTKTFNGSLLWHPASISKLDQTPYKVFTPYYRNGCLRGPAPRNPLPPASFNAIAAPHPQENAIASLKLLAHMPWESKIRSHWSIGEQAATEQLQIFLESKIDAYRHGRDFPAMEKTSNLSPYLHFGEISPQQVYHSVKHLPQDDNTDHFLSELGWREFSYYLLWHFPSLPKENFQPKFDRFPWRDHEQNLQAWQHGQTGYPIIDAAMRQLYQTGTMHNRLRMIVGSFLVKNLGIHWHHGAYWFWQTLVDADLANNSASWQWIAGCGADAAPYFRIFNPVTQAKKFDPDGTFIKQYLPELAKLKVPHLFSPWEAPDTILERAQIKLGVDYPYPLVDLGSSRQAALEAYQAIKNQ